MVVTGPDSKKPNLKPKADLAGWLDKLGSGDEAAPQVKLVAGEPEAEITGTNVGAAESEVDGAITGTEAGAALDEEGESDLQPGYVIADQYEVISLLGQGGMSAVYKAQDRLMKRVVAVKCLHARMLSDKNSILRFQKEAQAAGNLNHPHIVKIHQYGLDTNKRPFLVMDYLEGQSLQELIDGDARVPVEEALRIMIDAADGLDQAHKKGVVHRDFKPSNIMLVKTDEEDNCVKLVDFGIAKLVSPPGEEKHNLTQTGEMLGSPNYMSPEQCLMLELDNRSDIYAFGCTLFAALTGRAPFSSTNLVEIYYKHLNNLPESISVSRPDIREAAQIDAVILKCMAKDPADRYKTMAEARAALQAVADRGKSNLVGSLKDQLELNRLKGKARKGKKLSLIALSAGIGILACVGLGAYYSGHSSRSAEQNWRDYYVKGQQSMDAGNYKEAADYLGKALDSAKSTGKTLDLIIPTVEEMLDLAVITNDRPNIQKYRAEIAELQKQYENSFPELDKQIHTALLQIDGGANSTGNAPAPASASASAPAPERLSKLEIENLCQAINDQARQLLNSGHYDRAIDILGSAEKLANAFLDKNAEVQARTFNNMAVAYNLSGRPDQAYELYRKAIDFVRTNMSPQDPFQIKPLISMANVDWHRNQYDLAQAKLREAAKIVNMTMGPKSAPAAKVKVALAELYTRKGESRLALTELKQAWEIYEQLAEPDPESKARCAAALAYAQKNLHNFSQALGLQESLANKEKSTLVWLLESMGDTYWKSPDAAGSDKDAARQKAAAYYKRALALAYRVQPRDEERIFEIASYLNNYYREKNETLAMVPWFEEKISYDELNQSKNAPQLVEDEMALAAVYRQARQLPLCEQRLEKALALAQKNIGGNNGALVLFKVKAALGAVCADSGQSEKALQWYKQSLELFETLSPAQRKISTASDFFYRYSSLLEKLNKADLARELKTNHAEYFGK